MMIILLMRVLHKHGIQSLTSDVALKLVRSLYPEEA